MHNPFEEILLRLNQIEAKIERLLEREETTLTTDEFISIDEAVEFLRLKKNTIYHYVSRSKIPHMKKGKKIIFSTSDLREWLKSGRKQTIEEIEKSV